MFSCPRVVQILSRGGFLQPVPGTSIPTPVSLTAVVAAIGTVIAAMATTTIIITYLIMILTSL